MDKETKELLKRTLSMTDDKLLLKFAKSYAAKDQAFAETILQDSRGARDRERYRQIANGLNYLSLSCEEGKQQARRLASQILRENPGKPAFREEIEYYEY